MFEHRSKPLLPRREYYRRIARHAALGFSVIAVALGIGMTGYHFFEKLPWIDAFVNAAMILSGMGPVATLQTDGGKIFAGCYALFSGLALICRSWASSLRRSFTVRCTNFIWRMKARPKKTNTS